MRSKILFLLIWSGWAAFAWAQKGAANVPGPHQVQLETLGHPEFRDEAAYDKASGIVHKVQHVLSRNCILKKQVYGWHPAWSGTAYQQYDYALLTTVGYYAYEVNPLTGAPKTVHQWRETQMVEMAHNAASQVELTAALFGRDVATFLKNPKACATLCDSLLEQIQYKDADGVCLDFQGLQPANAAQFVNFVDSLAATLRTWRKEATITVTLPATDASHAYDIANLSRNVNRFIVMAYDYRQAQSAQAGPVAPMHGSARWGEAGLNLSLRSYLDAGAPANKLLAGVPYYGYRWPVASAAVPAQTTGPGELVLLRDYEAMDSSAFLNWDSTSVTGWLQTGNSQVWIDQVSSLNEKFSSIQSMGIAGVGIWALGYDHGSERYWNLIKGQFADCGAANADELARTTDTRHPALQGQTSAERNTWNWVWMLGGGAISILIMYFVKRSMK